MVVYILKVCITVLKQTPYFKNPGPPGFFILQIKDLFLFLRLPQEDF
jgi:hypothetical protein